jgi:hypothetical protein
MTSSTECIDEGCGLDGHGQHSWRFSGNNKNMVFRHCGFCGLREESKVKWKPET